MMLRKEIYYTFFFLGKETIILTRRLFDSNRIESNRIESDTPFRERNDTVAMTLLGLCEKGLGKDERHE